MVEKPMDIDRSHPHLDEKDAVRELDALLKGRLEADEFEARVGARRMTSFGFRAVHTAVDAIVKDPGYLVRAKRRIAPASTRRGTRRQRAPATDAEACHREAPRRKRMVGK